MSGGAELAGCSPARPKASIEETSRGLEIVIPARRNGFITLFLGFWLCGWAIGEIMVPATFFAQDAGVIPFDHGAATPRFGAALEEGEAKTIIERLRSRTSFG